MNMHIADLPNAVEMDRAALAAVFGASGTLKYTSSTSSGSWSSTSTRRYSVYKTVTVGGFLGIGGTKQRNRLNYERRYQRRTQTRYQNYLMSTDYNV